MRRLVAVIDQLPAWQFVGTALLALSGIKAWWMAAHLVRNPGAAELGGLVLLAGSIVLTIFAIRRRQTGVWDAAAQVILTIAGANMLSYAFLIPFMPDGARGQLATAATQGLGQTLIGVGLAIPVQAAGLWLSRRFGSHSAVTERRLRVVRKVNDGDPSSAATHPPVAERVAELAGAPPAVLPLPAPEA